MKIKGTENCFGEKLSRILIKPDTEFFTQDAWIMADEIVFVFEKSKLQIHPLQESDEIKVSLSEYADGEELDGFAELKALEKYIGQELLMTWSATNSNNCFDSLMVAFNYTHPNLIILSEGSVLKVFDISQMKH